MGERRIPEKTSTAITSPPAICYPPLPQRQMSIVEKIGWFLANSASSIAVMISLFFWLFLYKVSSAVSS